MWHQGLGDRADREREQHRADAQAPPQHQPDEHDNDLERRTHEPDREPGATVQAGHQPVTRSAPELGADVERRGEPTEQDTPDRQPDPDHEQVRALEQAQRRIGGDPDDDRVGDRADTGHLLERDPEDQHQEADDDEHLAEAERHVVGDARVEHVPWSQPQAAAHHHRQRDAVQHQADRQLRQTPRQAAGPKLGDGAEVDEAWQALGAGRRGALGHVSMVRQIGIGANSQS